MKTKLAGHLPLQDAIARTIEEAREKMKLASDACEGEDKEKVKKLVKFEKKEHGHIPSEKEERAEYEKKSSIIDTDDPEEVEKLAASLDFLAEKIAGDSVTIGGESRQGGQVLATMNAVGGTQPYKKDSSKSHNVPTSTGMKSTKDNPGASTAVPTDDERAPGGTGAKYPAKGVLKTGGVKKTAMDYHQARAVGQAVGLGTHLVGGAIGYQKGKEQHARGEKHTFGVPQGAAALFLPGGAGYQLGRYMGHNAAGGEKKKGKKKHSSVERLQLALAAQTGIVTPEMAADMEKDAGKVTDALKSMGGKARAAGGRVMELLKGGKFGAGNRASNYRPGARGTIPSSEAWKSLGTRAAAGTAAVVGGKKAYDKLKKKGKKKAAGVEAVDYILSKISAVENGGESPQGGEQLSNTAPVPSNAGRELIRNKDGIKNVTKAQAKSPRKKELAEVLTEPAMSAAHDSKVNENLRNAAKGGVKIAAARVFLQKIASEGCQCSGAGKCRFCQMQEKAAALRGNGAEAVASEA